MAVDQIKTLAFLKELSEAAITEARNGSTILANRLGGNIALKHYFDNRHAINPEAWARNYPQYMAEADRIRVAADEAEQRETERTEDRAKIATLEQKFDALAEQLKAFIESQQKPADVTTEAKKRGRPAKAKADPEPESEDDTNSPEDAPPAEGE